jgi:hypothetical protein
MLGEKGGKGNLGGLYQFSIHQQVHVGGGLFLNSFYYCRMAMAYVADADTGYEVEEFVSGYIPHVHAFSFYHFDAEGGLGELGDVS